MTRNSKNEIELGISYAAITESGNVYEPEEGPLEDSEEDQLNETDRSPVMIDDIKAEQSKCS